MYASSVDKYGTGRTTTSTATKYHHHLHLHRSGGGSSYSLTTEPSSRSSYNNSVSRLQASRSSSVINAALAATRLTDINGNVRSLSLTKSPSYSITGGGTGSTVLLQQQNSIHRGDVVGGGGGTTAALLLSNDKRYDTTRKRLDAFYNSSNSSSRSPSSSSSSPSSSLLLNKSPYRATGNLSYFEKYNKQQQDTPPPPPNDPPQPAVTARYVTNMNKNKYGTTDNGTSSSAASHQLQESSSSYRSDSKKAVVGGVVGIRNIGNTCYMNSVLQCLSNTKGLTDSVLDGADRGADGKLIRVYRDLLSRIWSGNDGHHPVDTTAFKTAFQRLSPRFAGYEQQDSQEFLRLLLDRLHMDVNRAKAKPRGGGGGAPDPDETLKDNALAAHFWHRYLATDNSIVVDQFAGQLKSTLECSVCGHKSITFEVFWDLSLSLPSGGGSADQVSLADLLDNFTQEEVLDYRERPRCGVCKADRKMYKAYSFQKLPRYLVLHLKRFQGTHSYKKITSLVSFPLTSLDMSPYVSGPARSTQPAHGNRYSLYAVSNHSGTPIAGHYTAFCKHPATGDWNFFNDSSVSRITSPTKIVSNEAYILFYEAVAAAY